MKMTPRPRAYSGFSPGETLQHSLIIMYKVSTARGKITPFLVFCSVLALLELVTDSWTIDGTRAKSHAATSDGDDDDSISHLCSLSEISEGQWVNMTYDKLHYVPTSLTKRCPNAKEGKAWQTWEWQPSSACEFARFDQEKFCQLAKNNTIAIIGDSISLDHYLSLTHLLGAPMPIPRPRDKHAQLQSQVCNDTVHLVGQRDFFLEDIANLANEIFPDVIIVNRGAHYVPDNALIRDFGKRIFPHLLDWKVQCQKQQHRKCLLIWRTTVPGHPNCTAYTKPASSVNEMEKIIQSHDGPYNWHEFSHQNDLVLELFSNQNHSTSLLLDVWILDAYRINILRPDLHVGAKDCLHTVCTYYNTCSYNVFIVSDHD